MSIRKINVEEFVSISKDFPVFDVRTPGEYKHAHIPGAISLPLLSDEERVVIGTAYKQESRHIAIKKGLDFFGPKMRALVEEVERLTNLEPERKTIVIHCWRGGMRSGAVAWLLDMYGYTVLTISGGYKAFRKWALLQFEKEYNFKLLGGYTGSGKTPVLHEVDSLGHNVIDLENLANHRGSAFGGIGMNAQPSQEMFENILAVELYKKHLNDFIWLEDESQRIGTTMIPKSIWILMRSSPIFFIDIDFEERLKYLVHTYGIMNKEELMHSIKRITKRLGGLESANAINHILENNIPESFRILLRYYDKLYSKGLYNREGSSDLITVIKCNDVDAKTNGFKVHSAAHNLSPIENAISS